MSVLKEIWKDKNWSWSKTLALFIGLMAVLGNSAGYIDDPQYQDFLQLARDVARAEVLAYLEPKINPSIYVTARDYHFAVIDVEDYAILFNGATNKIISWDQNDDGRVLNWALGNLTSGRTWMERVVFIGNFTVTETLNPYAYTQIFIRGVLKAQTNLNDAIIEQTSAGSHIEIYEGEIDGNLANQATVDVGRGIEFQNVDEIKIESVWIHHTKGEAVRLRDGEQASLDYTADHTEGSLLTVYNFDDAQGAVNGHNVTDDPMFQILAGSKGSILDLIGETGSEDGLTIDGESTALTSGSHIRATIKDVADNGLEFLSYAVDNAVEITVEEAADYGAYTEALNGNNTIHDSTFNGTGSIQDGAYVAGEGLRVLNTHIFGYTTAGKAGIHEVAGALWGQYVGNDLRGNDIAAIRVDPKATWLSNKGDNFSTVGGDWDYKITPEGSTYLMVDGSSGLMADIGTFDNLVEYAMGNLTSGGRIVLDRGEFIQGGFTDVDACESGWVSDDVDVTVTHDGVVYKEGTYSTKFSVAAGFGTGLMGHKQLSSTIDFSEGDFVFGWFRTEVDFGSNVLSFVLDDATDCSSPHTTLEVFHTENLDTNTWKLLQFPSGVSLWGIPLDLSGAGTVNSIGIQADADPGTVDFYLDDVDFGFGVIKVDDANPFEFLGMGMNQSIIKTADGSNICNFYVTAADFVARDFGVNGNLANIDAVDGCSAFYNRFNTRPLYERLWVFNVRGHAFKQRDGNGMTVQYSKGYNIQNPFFGTSYSDNVKCLYNWAGHITNDDPCWVSTADTGVFVIGNTFFDGVGNLIRIQGGVSDYTEHVVIALNYLFDAPTSAIAISRLQGFSISNNMINATTDLSAVNSGGTEMKYGLYFMSPDCDMGSAKGDYIGYTRQYGIFVADGEGISLVGEILENCGWGSGSYDAIRNQGDNITIMACVVRWTLPGTPQNDRAIKEVGATNSIYVGNYVEDHQYYPSILLVDGSGAIARDNIGFNPTGVQSTPWDNVNDNFGQPDGDTANPLASTDYTCQGVDCTVYVAGDGTGVTLVLKDPSGTAIVTYTTDTAVVVWVPIGYQLNFGAFSVAPTTAVAGN